ncbi:MAG: anthranilate synthase component I family protein, partial [Mailhella sp.]
MEGKSSSIRLRQNVRSLPADMDTPISLFLDMVGERDGILLESAEVDGRWGRYSVLACDMALYLICRNGRLECRIEDERMQELKALEGMEFAEGLRAVMRMLEIVPDQDFVELPPITRSLCGYMGFGMAALFNPKLAGAMRVEDAESVLCLPGTMMLFDHMYNKLVQISLGEHRDIGRGGAHVRQNDVLREEGDVLDEPSSEGFQNAVEKIREMLRMGEAIQVVPSVRFSMPFDGDPFTLYRRMRSENASPYMFFMRLPDITLFGSSPEVMVRCEKGKLLSAPIAGTRRRGSSVAEDEALARELLADPKERAEHMMLVDLGRNDLGRLARPGSVEVEKLMMVEKFSHVMHLTSRVTAELEDGLDAVDVLASTFPAGTVSGAPKIRAMEIISETEPCPRGPYAGCIGWLGLDKDSVNLDTGITIRSMWLRNGT